MLMLAGGSFHYNFLCFWACRCYCAQIRRDVVAPDFHFHSIKITEEAAQSSLMFDFDKGYPCDNFNELATILLFPNKM